MSLSQTLTQDNRDLALIGPGTPMGNLMRCYWLPAMMSNELKPGGDPVRLMLLGEELVAFRSPSGDVGVMDHRCPHRNASLFFGRNEEGGLRCIYHGWKFDATGKCVEVPNTPARFGVQEKVKTTSYKTYENKGLVWVYMGKEESTPELPKFEVTDLEEGEFNIEFVQRECNYLQALEGDIDTSHLGFLHVGNVEPEHLSDDDTMRYVVGNRAPELEVSDAPWGTMYCGIKETGDGRQYFRYANFLFPFWTQAPQGSFESNIFARAWVPMDDTHTMSITLRWNKRVGFNQMKDGKDLPGIAPLALQPNTTGWLGRFRAVQGQGNDYLMDRDAQRSNRIFSGIENIGMQDQAVTESMGAISDHSHEHLTPTDLMIARTRRRLLRAARALAQEGSMPPGVHDPMIYADARSGDMVVPGHAEWTATYQEALKGAIRANAGAAELPQNS